MWYDTTCIKSRADALANLPTRARWPTEAVSGMRSWGSSNPDNEAGLLFFWAVCF